MAMRRIPASAVAVGHCVIVNEFDRPYGRLVAVVVKVEGDSVWCKYLCSDPLLDKYSEGDGMRLAYGVTNITPVELFGVWVHCSDGPAPAFVCDPVAKSRATYLDGKPRLWQDPHSEPWAARPELAALCLREAGL